MMRSIGHCTAGRAKMKIPEPFRRLEGAEALRNPEDWLACYGAGCSHQGLAGAFKGA